MGQDPNFHISVPSGWAKLGNVFHVRICQVHYLSHDRPLNSAAFMWLSPISIILLFKNNIFLFVSDFQSISIINLSSMIVLMKYNCNKTIGYQFWLDESISWKKSSNYDKFRQNVLPFHNQWKMWMPSVHSILMLYRPNLVRNCSIVNCIYWYLHIVDTSIISVARSWWIIRSYPYPQNSGIPEVVTFFKYIKKQTAIWLLAMELTVAQCLYISTVISAWFTYHF